MTSKAVPGRLCGSQNENDISPIPTHMYDYGLPYFRGKSKSFLKTLRNFNVPLPGCKSNCKPTLPKIFQLLHLEKYTSETSFENEKVRNQVAFLLI